MNGAYTLGKNDLHDKGLLNKHAVSNVSCILNKWQHTENCSYM